MSHRPNFPKFLFFGIKICHIEGSDKTQDWENPLCIIFKNNQVLIAQ